MFRPIFDQPHGPFHGAGEQRRGPAERLFQRHGPGYDAHRGGESQVVQRLPSLPQPARYSQDRDAAPPGPGRDTRHGFPIGRLSVQVSLPGQDQIAAVQHPVKPSRVENQIDAWTHPSAAERHQAESQPAAGPGSRSAAIRGAERPFRQLGQMPQPPVEELYLFRRRPL